MIILDILENFFEVIINLRKSWWRTERDFPPSYIFLLPFVAFKSLKYRVFYVKLYYTNFYLYLLLFYVSKLEILCNKQNTGISIL